MHLNSGNHVVNGTNWHFWLINKKPAAEQCYLMVDLVKIYATSAVGNLLVHHQFMTRTINVWNL